MSDVYFTRPFRVMLKLFASVRRFAYCDNLIIFRHIPYNSSFTSMEQMHDREISWNQPTISARSEGIRRARARDLQLLNKGVSRCNWVRCRKYGAHTCYSAGREPCSRFLIKPVVITRASARPAQNRPRARNRFLLERKFMDVDFSWRTIICTGI